MTTTMDARVTGPDGRLRARGVAVFLAITFGLAWIWEAVAHLALGWSLVNPLVQIPAAFAPAIGALVVRRWVTREGFADSGSRPRFRAAWRYYLLAWLGPIGVAVAVVALGKALGGGTGPAGEVIPGLPMGATIGVLCLVALVTTFLFWGEEFGWTGYLLVRVFPGRPRSAALVAGLIAGVWHFPLALLGYVEYENLVLGLLGWTGWIVCQEVILAWLRERSGSVWPACLAHAGNNMILAPLTTAALHRPGDDENGVQLLIVIVLAVLAAGPFLRARPPQDVALGSGAGSGQSSSARRP